MKWLPWFPQQQEEPRLRYVLLALLRSLNLGKLPWASDTPSTPSPMSKGKGKKVRIWGRPSRKGFSREDRPTPQPVAEILELGQTEGEWNPNHNLPGAGLGHERLGCFQPSGSSEL